MTGITLFGRPLGLGLLLIEKCLASLFFLAAFITLLVFYFKGIQNPAQQLFGGELSEDPHDLVGVFLITHIPSVGKSTLLALALASFLYLLLELVEATGLILERPFGEAVIVVETALFLPLDVYELQRHFTIVKVGTIVLNLIILAYLVRRFQRKRRWYMDERRAEAVGKANGLEAGPDRAG